MRSRIREAARMTVGSSGAGGPAGSGAGDGTVHPPQAARYALPNTTALTITATPIHTTPHAVVDNGVISGKIDVTEYLKTF